MQCAESLRVQAYFDGEVDAPSAAELERHIERCAECRILLQDLGETRAAIRRDLTVHRAPPELRARITRALDHEAAVPNQRAARVDRSMWRARPFWAGALGGVGVSAAAAMLVFLSLSPSPTNALLDDVVAAHVASLAPSRLIEVESTDRHTVKPWFAGHADVSPVVADFAPQGYRLLGGRADDLNHQRSAVVVYQHGRHLINVFSWVNNERGYSKDATRNGYHLAFWQAGNLQYCAVSDTGWDELEGLVDLLKDLSARDTRE